MFTDTYFNCFMLTCITSPCPSRMSMIFLTTRTCWSCERRNFCTRTGMKECMSRSGGRSWRLWMARTGLRMTAANESFTGSTWNMSTEKWVTCQPLLRHVISVCTDKSHNHWRQAGLSDPAVSKNISYSDMPEMVSRDCSQRQCLLWKCTASLYHFWLNMCKLLSFSFLLLLCLHLLFFLVYIVLVRTETTSADQCLFFFSE